jgi:hypothetical protein
MESMAVPVQAVLVLLDAGPAEQEVVGTPVVQLVKVEG